MSKWIKCETAMPPEHESIFAKFKGTGKWQTGLMWETASHEVLVTLEYKGGKRIVSTARTHDGVWVCSPIAGEKRVIAWMPFPEPITEESYEKDQD